MLGFNMTATPPLQEAFNLVMDDTPVMFDDWGELQEQHCLSLKDLSWVTELATFKSSYALVGAFPFILLQILQSPESLTCQRKAKEVCLMESGLQRPYHK